MTKRLQKIVVAILCIMIIGELPLFAADNTKKEDRTPVPYTKTEFPLWQRELRRFEILTFGALPFVTMMSFWGYDMIRAAQNPKNPAYYPWPFKSLDKAAPLTEKEQIGVFCTAIGISIAIALGDIIYRAIKRRIEEKRLEQENLFLEDPIQFTVTKIPFENEKSDKTPPMESVKSTEPQLNTHSLPNP